MFWAGLFRAMMVLAVCVVLSGCTPTGAGPSEEEKEPHFLAGKSRISTLDYKGAIDCFEKALQVNPQSAAAHFELAWLFDVKEVDPAAAIYHYDHYLKLRPHADNADLAKERIGMCKQALAQSVTLGPVTERVQRQFEQVTEENKRLIEDKKRLQEEIDKWSSYAARLQTLTNQSPAQPASVRAEPSSQNTQRSVAPPARPLVASVAPAGSSTPIARTHTVKAGETAIVIARKYGVKLEALLGANPGLDPRRLRVGQAVRIPGT